MADSNHNNDNIDDIVEIKLDSEANKDDFNQDLEENLNFLNENSLKNIFENSYFENLEPELNDC